MPWRLVLLVGAAVIGVVFFGLGVLVGLFSLSQ